MAVKPDEAITDRGSGAGAGLFKPVNYARTRDGYRPPPRLYSRLTRWDLPSRHSAWRRTM